MVPEIPISGENAVAKKIFPVFMEGLPLPEVTELGGEDGFDILRLRREDKALPPQRNLDSRRVGATMREEPCPELQVSVLCRILDRLEHDVDVPWEPTVDLGSTGTTAPDTEDVENAGGDSVEGVESNGEESVSEERGCGKNIEHGEEKLT